MGLIRLLILAALVYVAWRLAKRLLHASGRGPARRASGGPPRSEKMIKCRQCGVHVPERDAFHHRALAFCSLEHQRRYLEHHDV